MRRPLLLLLVLLAACSRDPARSPRSHSHPACQVGCAPDPDPPPLAWEPATGPGSYGTAAGLFVDGDHIAMSGYGRVLLSDDAGATWTERAAPVGQLFDVVRRKQTLVVNDTFTGEAYRSLDGGQSWGTLVPDVASFATRGAELWVTTFEEERQVTRHSENAGATWTSLGPGAPIDIVPGEGDVLLGHQLGVGLFYSGDRGATWAELPMPNGDSSRPLAYWRGRIVATYGFADGTGDRGIALTDDLGKTWSATRIHVVEGWRSWIEITHDGLFVITAVGEVLRLKDPSAAWEVLAPFEGKGGIRVDAAWGGDEGLYVVLDRDLVRWDEGRLRFVRAGTRPLLSWVPELAWDGATAWALVSANEIQRTTDGGRTWKVVNKPRVDLGDLGSLAAGDGVVYAGTAFSGIFRSGDGGRSWSALGDRMPHVNGQAGDQPWGVTDLLLDADGLYASTAALQFAGGSDGNFVSTGAGVLFSGDGGESWAVLDRGLPPGPLGSVSPTGPLWEAGHVIFTAATGGLFRSSDHRTWTGPSRIQGAPDAQLASVLERGGELLAAFQLPDPAGRLFTSADRGATWEPGATLPGVPLQMIELRGELVLLTAPAPQHPAVWSSGDGGATWSPLGVGTPASGVALLATDRELLLGTPGQGVPRLPLAP